MLLRDYIEEQDFRYIIRSTSENKQKREINCKDNDEINPINLSKCVTDVYVSSFLGNCLQLKHA